MSVTVINAGTQHNVVPDKCTFVVDIRSNELYSNEDLFAEIRKHIACDAKARSFRLNSSRIDEKHPFVQKAVKMGRIPFGSPTLSDQALMSFASVKIGGTLFTFTYSRRVYYAERDRRGYRDLFRFVRRTKALVRLYHSSSRKSAICRCLTPSILSCHKSSILTTYLG